MKYFYLFFLFTTIFYAPNFAQPPHPVEWSTSIKKISNIEYQLVLTAKIDSTWKIHGIQKDEQKKGPLPFAYEVLNTSNISKFDTLKSKEKPNIVYDPVFKEYNAYHRNQVNFIQTIYIDNLNKDTILEARFEYMTLNDFKAIAPILKCLKFHIKANPTSSKRRVINVGKGDRRIYDCN